MAAPMSTATSCASCAGPSHDRPTTTVSQIYTPAWITSSDASSATKPNAMRQYRLRYQTGSDIGELVSRAPHGQHEARLGGIVLDLAPHPLDERVHAALGDVRVVSPDFLHQRVAAEHDAAVAGEQIQQVEF